MVYLQLMSTTYYALPFLDDLTKLLGFGGFETLGTPEEELSKLEDGVHCKNGTVDKLTITS